MKPSWPARFWAKVEKTNGCWLWHGAISSNGYGNIGLPGGRSAGTGMAHRVSYELVMGPVPEGLHLDHLCRNRACVNPIHLEPVTARENLLRGQTLMAGYVSQSACVHGHPFDEANTYIVRGRDGSFIQRACRACARDRARRRYHAAKEVVA